MKIVKESLFEVFREESDPIEDMGIGVIDIMEDIKILRQTHHDTETFTKYATKYLSEFVGMKVRGPFRKGFFETPGMYEFVIRSYDQTFGFMRIFFYSTDPNEERADYIVENNAKYKFSHP